MRLTAEAANFEEAVSRIERIAERRRRLRRTAEAEYALVPGLAGELVDFLPGRCGTLRRDSDRGAPYIRSRDLALMAAEHAPYECRSARTCAARVRLAPRTNPARQFHNSREQRARAVA
jgi:hypothetical protein